MHMHVGGVGNSNQSAVRSWSFRSGGGGCTGSGENRRPHRLTRLGMAVLGVLGLGGAGISTLLVSAPAGALPPPTTCTWTGTTNSDWSVATNWSGAAASCTLAGGPVAGTVIVFPSVTNETVTYDSGLEVGGGGVAPASEFNSITFEDPYTVNAAAGAPAAITLTPTAATPCGASATIALCQSTSASTDFSPALVLGESEEFAASTGSSTLFLLGNVSGVGPLLINDATNTGAVALYGDNSYTGGTTIGGGTVPADNTTSFGSLTGTVTDNSAGNIDLCTNGATFDYPLTLGESGTVSEGCGNATWSGSVAIDGGGAQLLTDSGSAATLTVSGNISGGGPLAIASSDAAESSVLSGSSHTYSGTITVDHGATLVTDPPFAGTEPLGTGAVTVDGGGTLEGTGPSPSIDNSGTVAPGTTTTPGALTSSGADVLGPGTVDVAITGLTAGSGYTQLANSTSAVNVTGATLAVNDTCSAPYGTVFDVVSLSGSASEVGAFAGDPSGTVINSNGHLLKIAYSATTGVTLTDVTNPPPPASVRPSPSVTSGYRLVASDGGLFSYNATFYGSEGGKPLNQPIVGMATDSITGGYYEVASDGGIFAFNAPFYGSEGGQHLNQPIVGIAFDPLTNGYYEVASDGGIFAFNAPFYGSEGGQHLNQPIVGIAFDLATGGYYEVASDGGIFAFHAPFYGSAGSLVLNKPMVGMTVDTATGGYYEVASDGGIFAYNAHFDGSEGGQHLNKPIVGMAYDSLTGGYYEVASDGGIFAFDAPFYGSAGSLVLNKPIVGMSFG
jgi:hypothetical protein